MMVTATAAAEAPTGIAGFFHWLHSIKLGSIQGSGVPASELAYILRHLSTLVENGVSLPKAIGTIAKEASLSAHAALLSDLRRRLEGGESFSKAVAAYPDTFSDVTVNQIRVGERSGTMVECLNRIAEQLEKNNELWAKLLKRLSYPLTVVGAGAAVVLFMLVHVIPQFEETYRKSNIPLPWVTQFLIDLGGWTANYGWMAALGLIVAAATVFQLRKQPAIAAQMDAWALRIPIVGPWLRDIAVLQLIEVLGIMMESGYKLVDALQASVASVGNACIRSSVEELRNAVLRGERFSREIERKGDLFPPVVGQLVIVGEKTGKLARATRFVREHLRSEIDRKAEALVGWLEPVLTIGMAVVIGGILMAIYMPMFGMVDTITQGK